MKAGELDILSHPWLHAILRLTCAIWVFMSERKNETKRGKKGERRVGGKERDL